MERDILALINKENHKFSKGQRMICRYISENYDKAAFMTAGKLGQTVGVSESTVVRFATELGYDGYPGMRRAMQEMIRNRLTAVQRIEVAKEQIDRGNILDAVLSADMDKLRGEQRRLQPRGRCDPQGRNRLHRRHALVHIACELSRILSQSSARQCAADP